MAREYRDSGIEWIGQIPKEWNTISFTNSIVRMSTGLNPRDNFELTKDDEFFYVTIKNFKDGKIYLDENCDRISKEAWEIIQERSQLQKGDILFASISKDGQAYILEDAPSNWNINESVFCIRVNPEFFYVRYFYYHITDSEFYNDLRLDATGTTFQSIKQNKLRKSLLCLPNKAEQQKIADYLDKVCGEVDEMVTLQETMIEELKAYKQSVITEAVTKGLNPNVPMRDSGIDWIGEIPEHWKLEPLKYCFGRRSEKNNPVKTEERLSLSIDKGVTLYAEKTTNLDRFKDDFTQYQLAYPNDIVLNCMNMIVGAVGLSNYMGCVSPVYYVIYPLRQDINPLYYSYLLNIPTIRGVYYSLGKGIYAIERGEGRVNTCRLKVAYNDFGRLEIPVPPIEEQKEITRFNKQKCSEIDSLIALKQAKIEELKEYKKSVIYEHVTGKKEVV